MGELKVNGDACGMVKYNTTEHILREEIIAKANDLAELIASSDEVLTYQEAEKKIEQNERIQELIRAIKKKQKEIVGFEYFKNEEMVKKIEAEIDELQNELDSIPIVQQFQQSQSDINYLLQLVVTVIKDSLSNKISIENGPVAPPSSCSD